MGSKIHGPTSLDDFETLSLELSVKERCELIGGVVTRVKREATAAHHSIVDNMISCLLMAFRNGGSRYGLVGRTFWLKHRLLGLAVLPDIMVYEGRLFPAATSLEDPTVIIDIEGPEAPAAERAEKWQLFKRLKSLQHYVLVDRHRAGVDVFERIDGGWFFRPRLDHLSTALTLPAIRVELPLEDIYRDVRFS